MGSNRRKFLQSVAVGTGLTMYSSRRASAGEPAGEGKTEARSPQPVRKELPATLARAVDFEEGVVYRPAQRPGYCSWVTVWKGLHGSLLLNFCERRRRPNPIYRPIPLDFWEAMSLPIKYQSQLCTYPDILPEAVILKSEDQGRSWREVGRDTLVFEPFAFSSLPDGSILRGIENAYTAYDANEKVVCTVQKSTDLGNTWTDLARLEDNFWFSPYRMRVLRDGTVAMLGTYSETFGPGREKASRNEEPAGIHTQVQAAFFYSRDEGLNWQGPVPILPGVAAWEPEWVELASGDLLVINCDVQGGANTRQIVRRQGKRFVPQPVFDIVSGTVPETFVITEEGLLVGTRRGGAYSCSRDMGRTWYNLGGLPNALYQPRIIQLENGRFLSVFHLGGDNFVGEIDQYIGQHVFRLEEHLPTPITLVVTRDRNSAGTQYLNAYTATLAAGDNPLVHKEVKFTVRASSRDRRSYNTDEYIRSTDAAGRARLALPEFDMCIDIHRGYTVQAEYSPAAGDAVSAPARSSKYMAYRMTSISGKKNSYAFYVSRRTLFAEQKMLKRFPEIYGLVKLFGPKSNFSQADLERELELTSKRGKMFLDTMLRLNVLRPAKESGYTWNEVEVDNVLPITIEDDFVVS